MAYGLEPVRHAVGGTIRMNSFKDYTIASAYATSVFTGDPVKLVAAGTVEQAAAGDELLGVFGGVEYTASDGSITFSKYWPASTTATNIKAMVYDDPWIVYKAEADQDTTALAAADIGTNCDVVVAAGSTTTGLSGVSVDSSSKVASTAQVRILASAETDASFTSAGTVMDVYVVINEHFYKNTAGI